VQLYQVRVEPCLWFAGLKRGQRMQEGCLHLCASNIVLAESCLTCQQRFSLIVNKYDKSQIWGDQFLPFRVCIALHGQTFLKRRAGISPSSLSTQPF
jgi:hypothetical protein